MSKNQAVVPAVLVFLAVAFGLFIAVMCGRGSTSPGTSAEVRPSIASLLDPSPSAPPTATVPIPTATPLPLPSGPASQALREGRYADAAIRFAAEADAASSPGAKSEALLGMAIAKHQSGDAPGAIASLRSAVTAASPRSPEARRAAYLLGLRLSDGGDGASAALVLQPWFDAPQDDALQPYLDSELARAAALAGNYALSEQAFARSIGSPQTPLSLRADAYRGLASAARARHDLPRLAAALSKLIALAPDPASRYELATVGLSLNDPAIATAQRRLLVQEHPESRFALLALQELKQTGETIDAGQEGLVYYRRGLYAQAKATLGAARDDPSATPSERAFRAFYYAAALEDSSDAVGAIAAYDRVETYGGPARFTHRARYWAARVAEALGNSQDASRRYVVLATGGPPGEFSVEARFRAGFVLFRADDATGAISTWDGLGTSQDQRLFYWKGRALQQVGNAPAAKDAFASAALLDPHSFFGQAASAQAGTATPLTGTYAAITVPVPEPDWAGFETWLRTRGAPARIEAEPAAARELLLVGLRERAAALITEFGASGDPWRIYTAMRSAHTLGLTNITAHLAVQLRTGLQVEYEEAPRLLAQMAYPLDFAAVLNVESKTNGIDPLYLAALIRQESFWDPSALSHADAYGLTQVIPETGISIANALDVFPFETADLLKPAIAIKFGAYYISQQLKRYGTPYSALAAYNAGPGAAQRWADRAPSASAADFVETVDYAETQLYIQLVMQSYSHYVYAWRTP